MTKRAMNAREYRAHAQAVKAQAPTEIVTLSSGSVWELRRPDLQGFVKTGRVPQSLVAQGMAAWRKNGTIPGGAVPELDDEEVFNSLVFMREIVHDCTVNPKFVEVATADDEIGAAEMLPADFDEIFAWAMGHKGVAGHEGLESFRNGRRGSATGDSLDGEGLQPEAVESAAN